MAGSKQPRHGAQQHASGTVQMDGRGEKAHTCQTRCVESTSEKVEKRDSKKREEERGRREKEGDGNSAVQWLPRTCCMHLRITPRVQQVQKTPCVQVTWRDACII